MLIARLPKALTAGGKPRPETAGKLDLQNPRKHYYVTELRLRADNLERAMRGLSPEEMREFDGWAADI